MKYISIIEDYFLGKLKGEELNAFLSDLNLNSELKNEFNIYKKAFDFTMSQENKIKKDISRMKDFELETDLLLDIKKYSKISHPDNNEKVLSKISLSDAHKENRFKKWRNVAAIAILVFGLGITGIIFSTREIDKEELFQNLYSPYNHSYLKRSMSSELNNFLFEGLSLYDQKKYRLALDELEKIPDSQIENDELYIIKGNCKMELGQYSEAIIEFKKINSNSLLYTSSLWYQGLSFLMLNDKQNAKNIFQKLESFKLYYQKETKDLLKQL